MVNSLVPIPKILAGILCGFLAIMGVRITYPMVSGILNLWTETTIMYVVANLIVWLIYFFVLWVMVWAIMFEKTEQKTGGQ